MSRFNNLLFFSNNIYLEDALGNGSLLHAEGNCLLREAIMQVTSSELPHFRG